MLFPSNLFKGKDEKKETPDYEKIISEKNAEIESLRAEIERFKMNKIESSTEENTSKKLPIDITLLRNILLNTYNRIDRNNKAPRYSILNLLNIINYTQPSIETKVPAMQEINYIKSYIEVRKHASSERPMIRFTYAPTLRRQLVHSGLFLPLVNYAFENTMHGAQIDIKILEIDNAMTIDIVMPQNNNIFILKLEYTLTDQMFHQLFDDFSKYNKKYESTQGYKKEEIFDVFIKAKHRKYFSVIKKAILYDVTTKAPSVTEYSVLDSKSLDLSKILCFRCISARRDTVNKEGDSTLSTLSSRYYEKNKIDEDSPTVAAFEDTLHATDKELSSAYETLFDGIISKVKKFGGVRENETVVKIISTLSQQQLLKGNTTVVYDNNSHQLPESYNGLGYLNLISIIMEIEIYLGDFLRKNDETKRPADINLLFIEEPEAHTHPQLQYVFIKNIKFRKCGDFTNLWCKLSRK